MPKGKVRIRVICPLQKEKKWAKKKKFVIFYCKIYIYCGRRVLSMISYICRKMHKKNYREKIYKKNEIERMKIIKTT